MKSQYLQHPFHPEQIPHSDVIFLIKLLKEHYISGKHFCCEINRRIMRMISLEAIILFGCNTDALHLSGKYSGGICGSRVGTKSV